MVLEKAPVHFFGQQKWQTSKYWSIQNYMYHFKAKSQETILLIWPCYAIKLTGKRQLCSEWSAIKETRPPKKWWLDTIKADIKKSIFLKIKPYKIGKGEESQPTESPKIRHNLMTCIIIIIIILHKLSVYSQWFFFSFCVCFLHPYILSLLHCFWFRPTHGQLRENNSIKYF